MNAIFNYVKDNNFFLDLLKIDVLLNYSWNKLFVAQAFNANPELGMKSVKIVFSKSSFSYESFPVLYMNKL